MRANEYQALALRTLNPEMDRAEMLLNSVMGLCGESGEAIEMVKKHRMHGHPLDREKFARELGDVAWYLAEAAAAVDLDLEAVLQMNIDKLKARYPEGFSPEKSLERADQEA